jgi:hypothetical protein
MTAKTSRTLHDRLFKELLHRFLPDFLRIFFPAEAARLDLHSLTFLDQELILNLPNQTLRVTDIVAEAQTIDGEPEVIIVHVEVEGRDKTSLEKRMFDYYALLRLLREKPVLPLALVIAPNVGGLSWPIYRENLFGRDLLAFSFGQVGLRDLSGEAYINADPVAAALAALMRPGSLHPAELKLHSLRTVIDSGLTEGDKLFLINVIETYLPHAGLSDAGETIMQALMDTELSWAERIEMRGEQRGERKGQRQGELKGKINLLLRQLQIRFGQLPADFERQLQAIQDPAALDELSVQVITAATLNDIQLPTTEKG